MATLKGTVYLELPQPEWEGDPPTALELEHLLEDLVCRAVARYVGQPYPAVTVESRLACASCHAAVDVPEWTPQREE